MNTVMQSNLVDFIMEILARQIAMDKIMLQHVATDETHLEALTDEYETSWNNKFMALAEELNSDLDKAAEKSKGEPK